MYERLTLRGDKMELPLQIKPWSNKVFQNGKFCLTGVTEVSRRHKVHAYIPAGSSCSLCLRACLVMVPPTGSARTRATSKTPVNSPKYGTRNTPVVVTVPRDLVPLRDRHVRHCTNTLKWLSQTADDASGNTAGQQQYMYWTVINKTFEYPL